jgi:hypothetical protein
MYYYIRLLGGLLLKKARVTKEITRISEERYEEVYLLPGNAP